MLKIEMFTANIRKSQLPEHVLQHIWPQQPHNELSSRQVVRHIGCAVRRFHSYVIYQSLSLSSVWSLSDIEVLDSNLEGHPCESLFCQGALSSFLTYRTHD